MQKFWSFVFFAAISLTIVGCEGDYFIDYEWTDMEISNADNSAKTPQPSEADSIDADVYGIHITLETNEISREGRYADTESPPSNINPLDSVIITSTSDFDSLHPIGSNLADLFYFLNKNYLKAFPADGSKGYNLTNIYSDEFYDQLLVNEANLLLTHPPKSPGAHQFTVQFILQDSTVFIDSTKLVYLK